MSKDYILDGKEIRRNYRKEYQFETIQERIKDILDWGRVFDKDA